MYLDIPLRHMRLTPIAAHVRFARSLERRLTNMVFARPSGVKYDNNS